MKQPSLLSILNVCANGSGLCLITVELILKLSAVLLSSWSVTVLVLITGTLVDCTVSCVVVCNPRAV